MEFSEVVINDKKDKILEQIRQTSNVLQALENLYIQCGEESYFLCFKSMASENIVELNLRLQTLIHNSQ